MSDGTSPDEAPAPEPENEAPGDAEEETTSDSESDEETSPSSLTQEEVAKAIGNYLGRRHLPEPPRELVAKAGLANEAYSSGLRHSNHLLNEALWTWAKKLLEDEGYDALLSYHRRIDAKIAEYDRLNNSMQLRSSLLRKIIANEAAHYDAGATLGDSLGAEAGIRQVDRLEWYWSRRPDRSSNDSYRLVPSINRIAVELPARSMTFGADSTWQGILASHQNHFYDEDAYLIDILKWRREVAGAVLEDYDAQGMVLDYPIPAATSDRELTPDERHFIELALALRAAVRAGERSEDEIRSRTAIIGAIAEMWEGMTVSQVRDLAISIGAYRVAEGERGNPGGRGARETDFFWATVETEAPGRRRGREDELFGYSIYLGTALK